MGFIDVEKVYASVNREAVYRTLRIYNVGGKPLNRIKSMYVDILPYVGVKGVRVNISELKVV